MHDTIKRFGLTGTITADKFVATRESMIHEIEASMRDEGYVPVLDLMPQFTRDYIEEEENFSFVLSVYGTYVGETAWQVAGMMNGVQIPKSTHPTK